MRQPSLIKRAVQCLILAMCVFSPVFSEDWPEWRGKGRVGIWNESGILDKFPEKGLTILWRTPIHAGFAGPAVAAGRVFVTDFEASAGLKGTERALCLDEKSGKILWTRTWEVNYGKISYPIGPRATPTVDRDRVYIVGATGTLICLNVQTGDVIWQKDYAKDYGMQMPTWGITSAPLVDGDHLIAIVGGQPDAKVMALDKMTGKEIWRALPSDSEQGYCQPVIFEVGGIRQLIIWHPSAVVSLDPATGKANWQQPFKINMGMTLATPDRGELIISKLSPQGYQEISRTQLIKPTTNPGNRRELGAVNWSHPAYANRCIIARNDEEIISIPLEKQR